MYSLTKAHILGQLYSCQMSWYVLDCPMCPTGWWSCFAFNTCNQRSLFSGTKTCLSCSKTLLFLIDYWELSISLPNPSYSGRVRSAASTTLIFVSKELVSTVVTACNTGYGWEVISKCSFENIEQRFVALDNLSLLYTSHRQVKASGFALNLPGQNLMLRLNYKRNLDHLACQCDKNFDLQK